ncbi:MAG: hypothetical protein IMZ47_09545 [Firmicutes bacterium]|nr:hypothetical protein [Bacillota bacterium]
MVQIDDSGSGSLIGGTCIAALRTETGEYVFDFIPIEYYRSNTFKNKKYLTKSSQIVFSLLKQLDYKLEEEIDICQGYMFEYARKKMDIINMHYKNSKVGDPLQTKIEDTFQNYAINLGLLPQYVKYTKYPLHFHKILRWVYADFDKRAPLCKTGWKSWKKYSGISVDVKEDVIFSNNYICLKCGMKIEKGTSVKRLEYISNCPNTIYLHKHC